MSDRLQLNVLNYDHVDCYSLDGEVRFCIMRRGYQRFYNPTEASLRRMVRFLLDNHAIITPWVSDVGWAAMIEKHEMQKEASND